MALSRRRLWPALMAFVASITIEPMLFARNVALYGMSVIRENLKLDRFCRLTLNRTQDECAHMNDGEHDDLQVAVQKLDNAFILFESLVGSLVPILLVVFIASWSDRRGRKVPLVISLSGSALYAAVYLLEAVNPSWPPEVLLLASFLQSVGGGWVLFFMAAYSYIADHSSGESRTLRLTVMSAIWQLGGPAGTALAAWLFDVGGYAWVFGLSLALYVLCLLYTLLVVRDKAPGPAEGRPRAQAGGGGPCDVRNILDLFRACFRRRPGRGRLHLLLAMTFMLGAYSSGAHNMYLWTRRVLGWGSDQYSLYSTVNQLCQQGVMLVTAPLLRRLRVHDCVVGAGAALVNMAQLTTFGLTTTPGQGWVLYAFVLLPTGLVGVTIRAVLSKLCSGDEVGRVFSMLAILEIFWPIVDSLIFTSVYGATIAYYPSYEHFVAAGFSFYVFAGFLALRISMEEMKGEEKEEEGEKEEKEREKEGEKGKEGGRETWEGELEEGEVGKNELEEEEGHKETKEEEKEKEHEVYEDERNRKEKEENEEGEDEGVLKEVRVNDEDERM